MEIILDCKQCKNEVYIDYKNNKYIIECCDERFENVNREDLINEWNECNNHYYYIFGVIFEMNFKENQISKALDALYSYDNIMIKKVEMSKNLSQDELFNFSFDDVKTLFPECFEYSYSISGIKTRKNIHSPNYNIYKFNFSEKLERNEVETLIKYWTMEELNKYICKDI